MAQMNDCLTEYFRCPERYLKFEPKGTLSDGNGYFQLGNSAICFGSYFGHPTAPSAGGALRDALSDIEIKDGTVYLPFDPSQVADNLRRELYAGDWRQTQPLLALAKVYYFVRPLLSVGIRRHLQKYHLRDWDKLSFPRWPVDCSLENMFHMLLLCSVRSNGAKRIPFIWFWPGDAPNCAVITHDIETAKGRDFSPTVMDLDDSYGIKSSFEVIPEERYDVSPEFLDAMRRRGFEVVVHDLNHDGKLYRDRDEFLQRVAKINSYGQQYGAQGFRAAVLYRKQLWYDALKFAYDMSVPNVAHLDPQRGGCCTVMPYFLGDVLELPVTTTQDYTLFHILNDYSINLWKRQIELIMEKHGLISVVVHPDYIARPRERAIYEALLGYMNCLREEKGIWITTPGEVNRWWRQRAQMRLVENGDGWQIEGEGKERARIAYASEEDGRLVFSLSKTAQTGSLRQHKTEDL